MVCVEWYRRDPLDLRISRHLIYNQKSADEWLCFEEDVIALYRIVAIPTREIDQGRGMLGQVGDCDGWLEQSANENQLKVTCEARAEMWRGQKKYTSYGSLDVSPALFLCIVPYLLYQQPAKTVDDKEAWVRKMSSACNKLVTFVALLPSRIVRPPLH